MAILALALAVCALCVSVVGLVLLLLWADRFSARLANLALNTVKREAEKEPDRPDPSAVWEEGINNMLDYQLKNYGLKTDFLRAVRELFCNDVIRAFESSARNRTAELVQVAVKLEDH